VLVRYAILTRWARLVTTHPRATVAIAITLAAVALAITASRLTFQTSRSDLIDPGLAWQQRYAAFQDAFPTWDDLIVVIDSEHGAAAQFADALAARLATNPTVGRVNNGFATAESPPGLILSRSTAEIQALVDASGQPLLEEGASDWQHLRTASGRLLLLQVAGRNETTDERLLTAVRSAMTELRASPQFASIEAGVTGVPAMEMDESRQSIIDSTRASILALILISVVSWRVYRGWVVPMLAVAALLIGVAWSFGFLTLAIGHLQLLSVVFAVILLGLGIDTAIHLIARLELIHPDHDHLQPAVEQVFRGIGPGVLTGALTTAAAFLATAFTEFKGVAEMGIIASGGVILCTLAVMSIFPAFLELIPRPEQRLRSRSGGAARPYMRGRLAVLTRHARTTVTVSGLLFGILGVAALGIRYDPDLLRLQPPELESVHWEHRLLQDDARSFWHAVIVAPDLATARSLCAALERLETVDHVGGAGLVCPTNVYAKRALLRGLPAPLNLMAEAPVPSPDDLPEALRSQFIGTDGSLLLRVYPREGGGAVLAPDQLNPFVESVLKVAPNATGPSVQIYESTRVITRAYVLAAAYSAAAVLLLLLIDFRSIYDALTAMLPVILGFTGTFGIMRLTGTSLNFANIIVMPLIVGLGVDAGVHAVHRWLMQPDDRPRGLAGGTGRAITMTTATTAIGFACMMTAEHRGIRSLGFVMTIGLLLTWAATVFTLPSVLALRSDPGTRAGRRKWDVAHPPKSPELTE
jgi:predicted RND superfamily exporter protein